MPGVAIILRAADYVLNPEEIADIDMFRLILKFRLFIKEIIGK